MQDDNDITLVSSIKWGEYIGIISQLVIDRMERMGIISQCLIKWGEWGNITMSDKMRRMGKISICLIKWGEWGNITMSDKMGKMGSLTMSDKMGRMGIISL